MNANSWPNICEAGPPKPEWGVGEGAEGASGTTPPKNVICWCAPFLLMSPLNVLFLKKVTKDVHKNQQAKSRTS